MNLQSLRAGATWASLVASAIIDAVRDAGGTEMHLRALVSGLNRGLLRRLGVVLVYGEDIYASSIIGRLFEAYNFGAPDGLWYMVLGADFDMDETSRHLLQANIDSFTVNGQGDRIVMITEVEVPTEYSLYAWCEHLGIRAIAFDDYVALLEFYDIAEQVCIHYPHPELEISVGPPNTELRVRPIGHDPFAGRSRKYLIAIPGPTFL